MSAIRPLTTWRAWRCQAKCVCPFSVQKELSHCPPSSSCKWSLSFSQLGSSFPYVCGDTVYHPPYKNCGDDEPGVKDQTNWSQILAPPLTRCNKTSGKLVTPLKWYKAVTIVPNFQPSCQHYMFGCRYTYYQSI